eukprot:g27147.t1
MDRSTRRPCRHGAAVLGALAAAWWALAPAAVVTRDPRAEESASQKVASGGSDACGQALAAGQQRFEEARQHWLSESTSQRPIVLGNAAMQAEEKALAAFDDAAGGSCDAQRKALQEAIRKDVLNIFQLQRVIAERQALDAEMQRIDGGSVFGLCLCVSRVCLLPEDNLNRKLVKKMTQRGGPLRIQEKLDLLRLEVEAYKTSVQKLLPSWAEGIDVKTSETERRLGELQFTIEDRHPADMNLGIMNDGSIADVYREHPVPPLLAVQPAVNVNLNLR